MNYQLITEKEQKYVIDTYNNITNEFNMSRAYIWKSVKIFLDSIPPNSNLLEVGCGNGKNLQYINNKVHSTGIDICPALVKVCNEKGLNVILGNCLKIDFPDNTFDFVLCVAVIHHLEHHERRINSIKEMLRVLKPFGRLLIQVWVGDGDKFIDWKTRDFGIQKRFYHLYGKNELYDDCKSIENINVLDYYEEMNNWIIILQKI